jgi:hypothetical protein
LYMNPNTLSFLGGLAFMFSIGDHSAPWRDRLLLAVPAVLLLGFGQSRGAILAAIAALALQLLTDFSPHRFGRTPVVRTVAFEAVVITALWFAVSQWAPRITESLSSRVTSLLGVYAGGVAADTSVSGRLEFWSTGLSEVLAHPFGTWGPPQLVASSGLDNEYLSTLLQGGPLFLAAQMWMLLDAGRLSLQRSAGISVGLVAFVVFAGSSEAVTPMAPTLLFWTLLGSTYSASARGSLRTEAVEDDGGMTAGVSDAERLTA